MLGRWGLDSSWRSSSPWRCWMELKFLHSKLGPPLLYLFFLCSGHYLVERFSQNKFESTHTNKKTLCPVVLGFFSIWSKHLKKCVCLHTVGKETRLQAVTFCPFIFFPCNPLMFRNKKGTFKFHFFVIIVPEECFSPLTKSALLIIQYFF